MSRHIARRGLAINILKMLAVGVAIYFILQSPVGTRRLLQGIKKEINQRKARLTLDRLQRKKLVSYRFPRQGVIEVELTDAGRKKILEYEMGFLYAPKKCFCLSISM